MKYLYLLLCSFLLLIEIGAQTPYKDSVRLFHKNYTDNHEVVKGPDKNFLHFYEPIEQFRVVAQFEKILNGDWFQVPTSGKMMQTYRVYGIIRFMIHDSVCTLNLYQSQSLMQQDPYKNYLFLPFTDFTTGNETYETGRYIDLTLEEIHDQQVIIDFNKAYNPYCAYVSGVYNCPIPPKENHLPIAIKAGEQRYGKHQ